MQIIVHPSEFHINIPFDHYRKRNENAVKALPQRKWDYKKKCWVVPRSLQKEIQEIAQKHRAEVVIMKNNTPQEVGEIEPLPDLDFEIPLSHPEGFGLREYQGQGVARGLKLKKFINGDEQGLGKAQPLYSKIATPEGWKKMGDIKIWDPVFGRDGKVHSVTGIFPQGLQKTYRVSFNDGSYTDCNLDHIWIVRDQNRRRRGQGWINKTTQELLDSGLEYKTNSKRIAFGAKPILKWEIPTAAPVEYPEQNFTIPPYILGALLGDGCLTQTMIAISISDDQIQIKKEIEKLLPGNLKLRVNRAPACPQYYITQTGTTAKNPFMDSIKQLGIDVLSGEKFIPEIYLKGSIEQRKDLLKGLMDTDGSAIKNRIIYHTKSLELAKGVVELTQSLGGLSKIRPYDRGEKGIEYQVNVKLDFKPFKLEAKLATCWDKKRDFTSRYIKSIELIGEDLQQCISVSAPDHLYLTDNYIVTHNTLQSIATLYAAKLRGEDPFPALIICPASMKQTWQREWHQWTKIKALILNDSNKTTWPRFHEMGMADVFITNYESLKKFFVAYMPPKGKMKTSMDIQMKPTVDLFKSVVIDESHRCKDTGTQQAKLCLRIAMKKEWVILLTGTPVVNKPIDLYPQLGIMGQLGKFGGIKGYKTRYCNGGSGSSNLKELNYKLNKYCFFRREKKDVAKDLPKKQRQTILCDITTRAEYNRAKNDFVKHLEAMNFSDEEIARKLRGEIMVKMGELKRISALGKLNEVKEFVNEVIDSGEKLILFCSLHAIVDAMRKEYPDAVTVTGRDSMEQKQYSIDKFQRDPECKLIICNIKAAGVGITLTASSRVAFIEYPWTYTDCVQCEDRAHRIGQKNNVMCTYFLGADTIDEQMFELIKSKADTANTITGATDQMETSYIDKMINMFKKTA